MKEMSHSMRQCDHFGCKAMGGREEYCEVRGKDPEADIAIVTEYIDELLYSTLDHAKGRKIYESYEGYSRLQREFKLLSSPNKALVSPLIETDVAINRVNKYSPECVTYEIIVSWQIQHGEELDEVPVSYVTTYNLELWNASAQATITDYDFQAEGATDLSPRKVPDRTMTPYDYGVLFDLIRDIEAMQTGQNIETKPLT